MVQQQKGTPMRVFRVDIIFVDGSSGNKIVLASTDIEARERAIESEREDWIEAIRLGDAEGPIPAIDYCEIELVVETDA